MKKKYCVLGLIAIIAASFATGCSLLGDEIKTQEPNYKAYSAGFEYTSREEINEANLDKEVPEDVRDLTLEKQEDYDVTYEKVTATSSYDNICTMGVNNDILYPGALVDMTEDSYRPITIERSPVTISANLETVQGIDEPIFTTVDPSLSSVRTGIQQIVSKNIDDSTDLPANLSYEIREINNETEFLMNLGFGLQISKFSLSENFSNKNINKQTNLAIVLRQIYYTVDMDLPQEKNARDLFADTLSTREINNALEGTIPAYVSSVAYGRIAVITIQSNYSREEIANALSVGWGKMSEDPGSSSNKKLSGEFDSTLQKIATDTETDINCIVYGGATTKNINFSIDSSDTLQSVFSEFNGSGEGALPISYTLRHLNGELAKIQSNNEYVIKHVTYNPKRLMDWSYLDTLLQDGSLFKSEKLKLDFSAMVDYSNPEEADTNANRTITIPDNINELYILGPNRGAQNVEYNNFSIYIDYRSASKPLTIYLDSITFNGDQKVGRGACIYGDISAEIILDISRTVTLRGNCGASAIQCKNLAIRGDGLFSVYGGQGLEGGAGGSAVVAERLSVSVTEAMFQGGTGGTGITGEKGKQGEAGEDGLNQVAGKKGLIGGNGSDGGKGGDGGFAVQASYIEILSGADVEFVGGTGGTGGTGGQGGQGGNGGIGYAGVIGAAGAGNGGTGGIGGIGGQGGNGCVALNCDLMSVINGTVTIKDGNGGQGGSGGLGGRGGTGGKAVKWVAYCGRAGGGGDGGKGGRGGNGGGVAKFDQSTINFQCSDSAKVIFVNGVNGAGGEGGKGGTVGVPGKADLYNNVAPSGKPGVQGDCGQAG